MDKTQIDSFLQAGVFGKYSEGVDALKFFESEIERKMGEVVSQRDLFKEYALSKPAHSIKFSSGYYSGEKYVWGVAEGEINGQKTEMEIGILWECSKVKIPLMFYANFKEDVVAKFSPKDLPKQIMAREGKRYTRLYLVPKSKDFNLERDFALIIKELQRQVSRAAA